MRLLCFLLFVASLVFLPKLTPAQAPSEPAKLFARENLVAWCIVPFDSKHRTPPRRAAMLKQLGFKKFAYDWRAEHVASFNEEIQELKKHNIELTAWWFPAALNDDAQKILAALKRHNVKTQLWITFDDPAPQAKEQSAKVAAAVKQLQPIAAAAATQGCTIGLYNHGGWFGQPENQLAIIDALNRDHQLENIGVVYNQHHAHDRLDSFEKDLALIKPYLYALNLNGMDTAGDQEGRKILPLGQGEHDLALLEIIAKSGYRGPIGILGHTQDDAEARLRDNLDGLDWLVPQLSGKPAGPAPTPRTPVPPRPKPQPKSNAPAATFDPEAIKQLVSSAARDGDARRGLEALADPKFACVSCHQIGAQGGAVGPALTAIGKTLTPEQLAEALLWPKRQVKPEYIAWQVVTADGRARQGYKRQETAAALELFDIATQAAVTISKAEIDELLEVGTLMPDNLAASMTAAQRRDMLRALTEFGHTAGLAEALPHAHAHSHGPAKFAFDRAPLHPEHWPSWQHQVNRDRLYDFYAKEAAYFQQQPHPPTLLPGFPGLDSGKLGHWGNQNEAVWKDGRWNDADLGNVLAGVFQGPNGSIPKGVCVRLGDKEEMSVCFNPETLCYEAAWQGGFLKFSDIRHGFMDGLLPNGKMLPKPPGDKPTQPFVYHGFYRSGKRVIFAYRLGETEMLDAPWVEDGKFVRVVAPASEHSLKIALQRAERQWPQEIVVHGELGNNRPYAIDTIPLPFDNPWKAPIFVGDHAFTTDGLAYLCTMQGDVWRATGIDDKLERVTWRRIASGLHQPLGMVVHNDAIYVVGRDQLTRLHDLNNDGEADYYECFSNVQITSTGGHDYICGLEHDAQGRFYTASSKQGLIRISADGKKVEVLAEGFRNPDGLGLAIDGAVTVPCSEGDWTPASMICLIKPSESTAGDKKPPHFGYGGPKKNRSPALPLVYLPRGLDNSSGGQVTIPEDNRWGPFGGLMIHTSFGAGSHFLLLRDEVAGQPQGAVVPLIGEFRSGAHRAKFNPRDGQLYVCGMSGWGTYTPDDGCFQRVRYTGDTVQQPTGFHVHENGILITFAQPLDEKLAGDAKRHFAQVWNYRYSQGYGSPELATRHPGVVGHDALAIAAAHVVGKNELFLELPDLQPVNVLHLALAVDNGEPRQMFVTVHKLDQPYTKLPNYHPVVKTIAAHPLLVDLAALGPAQRNPWKTTLSNARAITLAAGKNLTFTPRTLEAKPGEALKLTFNNPDVVPHNWVLIKPGKLASIGELTNRLVADPNAVQGHYVPVSDDVLAYTDIVAAQGSFTIHFRAPEKPGRYPFLCTFPGHWMVMNGELLVK